MSDSARVQPHHVVIVGAGFGGLGAAHGLAGADVRITLIDQRNYHLFQPLLYQVATTALATSEIAWPVRHLLRKRREVTTLYATVVGVDVAARQVLLEADAPIPYDTLVLATGATHAYFGHDEWEAFAPGLKTLEDATTLRRRLLLAFELAEKSDDPAERAALMTVVVVGGGATGVELAGTIVELAHLTLAGDFRRIDLRKTRVVLVEAGARLLAGYPDELTAYTKAALEKLGVEVQLGRAVTDCTAEGVAIGEEHIASKNIIWAAGVGASPAAQWLGAEADRNGRVKVEPDMSLPGHPDIFVVGDTATVAWRDGKPVPWIAPAAKQQGSHVASIVKARLRGTASPGPFHYKHAGSLATIGRRAAVADFGRIRLTGFVAWLLWGAAHIYFLIGVRNRLNVMVNWLWIYVSGQRSSRLITQRDIHTGALPRGHKEPLGHRVVDSGGVPLTFVSLDAEGRPRPMAVSK